MIDGQPKKKKRMRLDPHDISNKRLDDSIAMNGQFLSILCVHLF